MTDITTPTTEADALTRMLSQMWGVVDYMGACAVQLLRSGDPRQEVAGLDLAFKFMGIVSELVSATPKQQLLVDPNLADKWQEKVSAAINAYAELRKVLDDAELLKVLDVAKRKVLDDAELREVLGLDDALDRVQH